jgi:hypothetical protein
MHSRSTEQLVHVLASVACVVATTVALRLENDMVTTDTSTVLLGAVVVAMVSVVAWCAVVLAAVVDVEGVDGRVVVVVGVVAGVMVAGMVVDVVGVMVVRMVVEVVAVMVVGIIVEVVAVMVVGMVVNVPCVVLVTIVQIEAAAVSVVTPIDAPAVLAASVRLYGQVDSRLSWAVKHASHADAPAELENDPASHPLQR